MSETVDSYRFDQQKSIHRRIRMPLSTLEFGGGITLLEVSLLGEQYVAGSSAPDTRPSIRRGRTCDGSCIISARCSVTMLLSLLSRPH